MGQANIELRTSPVSAGKRHSYLIFKTESGEEYIIRGGPSKNADMVDFAVNAITGSDQYGPIRMDAQQYALIPGQPKPVDWPQKSEVHEGVVLWKGSNAQLQEKLNTALKTAGQINAAQFEYSPLLNNCNNAANTILKSINITPSLPLDKDGKKVDAPASDTPLFKDVGPMGVKSGYSFDSKQWKDGYDKPMTAPASGKVFDRIGKNSLILQISPLARTSRITRLARNTRSLSSRITMFKQSTTSCMGGWLTNWQMAGAGEWMEPMLAETAYACVKNGLNANNIGYMDINSEKNNILVIAQDKHQFAVVNAFDAAKADPQERLQQASQLQETQQDR